MDGRTHRVVSDILLMVAGVLWIGAWWYIGYARSHTPGPGALYGLAAIIIGAVLLVRDLKKSERKGV